MSTKRSIANFANMLNRIYQYITTHKLATFSFIYDDGALFENGKAWVQIGDKQFEISNMNQELKNNNL